MYFSSLKRLFDSFKAYEVTVLVRRVKIWNITREANKSSDMSSAQSCSHTDDTCAVDQSIAQSCNQSTFHVKCLSRNRRRKHHNAAHVFLLLPPSSSSTERTVHNSELNMLHCHLADELTNIPQYSVLWREAIGRKKERKPNTTRTERLTLCHATTVTYY